MDDIFISCVRDDWPRVERLERKLEDFGYRVWYDRDPTVGRRHRDELIERLEKARTVLVAWSQHSTSSPWVQDEALRALKANKYVPVLIDICTLPDPFAQVRTFDLSAALSSDSAATRNEAWIDLNSALRETVGRTVVAPKKVKSTKKESRPMPSGSSSGNLPVFATVAALVGLAVGGVGATVANRVLRPSVTAPYSIDGLPAEVREAAEMARKQRGAANANAKEAVEKARMAQRRANSAKVGLPGTDSIQSSPGSGQASLYMGDSILPGSLSLGHTLVILQEMSPAGSPSDIAALGDRRMSYLGEHKGDDSGQSAKASGFGVRVADDLEYFQGKFHDNVPNGPGVLQGEDRSRYEGDFSKDRQDGYAVLIDGAGDVVYEGHWQSGERNGYGVEWSEHGCKLRAGMWGRDGLPSTGGVTRTICK